MPSFQLFLNLAPRISFPRPKAPEAMSLSMRWESGADRADMSSQQILVQKEYLGACLGVTVASLTTVFPRVLSTTDSAHILNTSCFSAGNGPHYWTTDDMISVVGDDGNEDLESDLAILLVLPDGGVQMYEVQGHDKLISVEDIMREYPEHEVYADYGRTPKLSITSASRNALSLALPGDEILLPGHTYYLRTMDSIRAQNPERSEADSGMSAASQSCSQDKISVSASSLSPLHSVAIQRSFKSSALGSGSGDLAAALADLSEIPGRSFTVGPRAEKRGRLSMTVHDDFRRSRPPEIASQNAPGNSRNHCELLRPKGSAMKDSKCSLSSLEAPLSVDRHIDKLLHSSAGCKTTLRDIARGATAPHTHRDNFHKQVAARILLAQAEVNGGLGLVGNPVNGHGGVNYGSLGISIASIHKHNF